jgi:hypothetical protein
LRRSRDPERHGQPRMFLASRTAHPRGRPGPGRIPSCGRRASRARVGRPEPRTVEESEHAAAAAGRAARRSSASRPHRWTIRTRSDRVEQAGRPHVDPDERDSESR